MGAEMMGHILLTQELLDDQAVYREYAAAIRQSMSNSPFQPIPAEAVQKRIDELREEGVNDAD